MQRRMRMTKDKAWSLTAVLAVVVIGCAVLSAQEAQKFPKVGIDGSQVRSMHSQETGRDYDLYIHVPAEAEKDKNKKYPVVYILDGQWDFKLMDSVRGGLAYDKFVPQMLLVGITYSGNDPDYNSLRAMDYM